MILSCRTFLHKFTVQVVTRTDKCSSGTTETQRNNTGYYRQCELVPIYLNALSGTMHKDLHTKRDSKMVRRRKKNKHRTREVTEADNGKQGS